MNYPESKLILEKIKKAKRILVNCHRGPDADSVGSAMAMYNVLKKAGKNVEIVYPSKSIPSNFNFINEHEVIKKKIDFTKFDFKKYDLFVTLDSSDWKQIFGLDEVVSPNIPVVVIDHHRTNTRYGIINLVDETISSTGELLYMVFQDWKIKIDKDTADSLLMAIAGDTVAFRYANENTFDIASRLMKLGADKKVIIFNLFQRADFRLLKFWGKVLERMHMDRKGGFVWSAVPLLEYMELGKLSEARSSASTLFTQIVEDTDFGMVMVEEVENSLSVSFRSRTGFDTSKLASQLGGGGHIFASAAKIEGLPFNKAVKKVLRVARKYAREAKSSGTS